MNWSGSGGNPPTCVAKEIIYEVVAGADVVKIRDAVRELTVGENATLWVTNRNVGNHFHEFANLAKKSKLKRVPTEDKFCVDCEPRQTGPDANVECSNSSYP